MNCPKLCQKHQMKISAELSCTLIRMEMSYRTEPVASKGDLFVFSWVGRQDSGQKDVPIR